MGLKVWFGVQQINIKNLGSTNISGLKNWIWSYFPFFVVKNVFDKILMKKSPIVLPSPSFQNSKNFLEKKAHSAYNSNDEEKKCAKYYMMHVTLSKVYSPLISFNALTNIWV